MLACFRAPVLNYWPCPRSFSSLVSLYFTPILSSCPTPPFSTLATSLHLSLCDKFHRSWNALGPEFDSSTKFVHVENCRKEIRLWHGSLLNEILTLVKIKLKGFTLKMVLHTGLDALSTQRRETRKNLLCGTNKVCTNKLRPMFFLRFFKKILHLSCSLLSSCYTIRSFRNPCFSLDKNVVFSPSIFDSELGKNYSRMDKKISKKIYL